MFILDKTILVEEFDSTDARQIRRGHRLGPGTMHSVLSFSPLRIAGELAKSVHGDKPSGTSDFILASLEAISMTQRLTARREDVVGSDAANVRLRSKILSGVSGVRDFSKSTRVGEYGQAICLVFIQDHLGFPIVFDFDVFCTLIPIQVLSKIESKPDFVAWNGFEFILVESKASLGNDSLKTTLREGLQQCDAGSAHIITKSLGTFVPAATYSVLTSFQLEDSGKDTKICFADPARTPATPDGTHAKLVEAYYRLTLQTFGKIGQSAPFAEDGYGEERFFIGKNGRKFTQVLNVEKPEWIEGLPPVFNKHGPKYSLWLDSSLLLVLRGGDGKKYNEEINTFNRGVALRQSSDNSSDRIQIFSDGLLLLFSMDDSKAESE